MTGRVIEFTSEEWKEIEKYNEDMRKGLNKELKRIEKSGIKLFE